MAGCFRCHRRHHTSPSRCGRAPVITVAPDPHRLCDARTALGRLGPTSSAPPPASRHHVSLRARTHDAHACGAVYEFPLPKTKADCGGLAHHLDVEGAAMVAAEFERWADAERDPKKAAEHVSLGRLARSLSWRWSGKRLQRRRSGPQGCGAGVKALATVTRTTPVGRERTSTVLASSSTSCCAALPRLSTSRRRQS